MNSVELGSEGGVSLGALLGDSSQVRGGPWLDAERRGEVREPEGGLVSRQPGQRQACWNSPFASQLVRACSEFGYDSPLGEGMGSVLKWCISWKVRYAEGHPDLADSRRARRLSCVRA